MDADLSELESDSDMRRRKRKQASNRAASSRYYHKHPENREKKRLKVQQVRAEKKLKRRRWDPPKRIVNQQLEKFPSEDLNLLTPRMGTPELTHNEMVQALEQDMQEFEERMAEKEAIASLTQLFQSHNSEQFAAHTRALSNLQTPSVNAHEQLATRALMSEEYSTSHMLPEEKAAHKPTLVRLSELHAARRAHQSRLAAERALDPWRIRDEELHRVQTIRPMAPSGYVFPPDLPPSDDPGTSSESGAESDSEWE